MRVGYLCTCVFREEGRTRLTDASVKPIVLLIIEQVWPHMSPQDIYDLQFSCRRPPNLNFDHVRCVVAIYAQAFPRSGMNYVDRRVCQNPLFDLYIYVYIHISRIEPAYMRHMSPATCVVVLDRVLIRGRL